MTIEERLWPFDSGELAIEGRLHVGDGSLAAVVMHPHPQYGGDMDNHVVMAVCEALASMGATTLRFNFRGVGASAGTYDNGRGEVDDARGAITSLRTQAPAAKLMIVGYSFGAMIAAAVAEAAKPAGLVLVSPPLGGSSFELAAVPRTLAISGDRDTVSPTEALMALASASVAVTVVPGVDHGWWPGIEDLAAALVAFARLL